MPAKGKKNSKSGAMARRSSPVSRPKAATVIDDAGASPISRKSADIVGPPGTDPMSVVPFHLLVDGVAVAPFTRLGRKAAFVVPAGAREVRLISPSWSPSRIDPESRDNRQLGLRIEALSIGDLIGDPLPIPLDDRRLLEGFHGAEIEGDTLFRWTDGNACLPVELWSDIEGPIVLRISGPFEKVWTTSQGDDPLGTATNADVSFLDLRSNATLLPKPTAVPGADAALFLSVDDGIIAPLARAHDKAAFVLPAGTRTVRLVSSTWSPADFDPASSDERKLGLLVRGLSIDNLVEPETSVALEDKRLFDGFHVIEPGLEGPFRWTNGNAGLSGDLWEQRDSAFVLRIVGQLENAATNPLDRELVLRFENLGADCEFGIVQRMLSAEPLGLLRWADVPFRSLMNALEVRFEGLGTPEYTTLSRGDGGEFFIRDKRWGLDMHTFIKDVDVDVDQVFLRMRRHVNFLKDKLVADLQSGAKIFIYKNDDLTEWELRALHDSLCEFGPVRLLHAKRAKGRRPVIGTRERFAMVRPGLFVAELESLARDGLDTRIDDWLRACRRVEQHWSSCATREMREDGSAPKASRAGSSPGAHTSSRERGPRRGTSAGPQSPPDIFAIPHAKSVYIDRSRHNGSGGVLCVVTKLSEHPAAEAEAQAQEELMIAVRRAARNLGVKAHAITWQAPNADDVSFSPAMEPGSGSHPPALVAS